MTEEKAGNIVEKKDEQNSSNNNVNYEVVVLQEKDNVIFDRKEVKGIVKSTGGTPSKGYMISYLASKYKVEENHIDLKYIVGKGGRKEFEFFALIYSKPIKEKEKEEGGEASA